MRRASAVGARIVVVASLAAVSAPALAQDGATTEAPRQIVVVVHAHSDASSGNESLQQLAARARAAGVDAIVLAENLGYEFRYAPWPLRYVVQARAHTPTLEHYGVDRYLAAIRSARAATDVLLIPGVETPPYYYWTGSLLRGDLTLHDMQRNVLVVPPVDAADGAVSAADLLRELPAVGNRNLQAFGARSLALLLPGLLLIAAALHRWRRNAFEARRAASWAMPVALLVGVALLWVNFPYTVAPIEPYGPDIRAPAQRLLDYVGEHGGLTFWSMPEASDYRRRAVGPFAVSLSTPPYPSALFETHGYTGFGGVYADTVEIWEPGNAWDQLLREFLDRRRDAPPWLVGESAYHYAGQAGKQLDDVLTVLLVDDKTTAAVFAALADGRAYALRRQAGSADLRLSELMLRGAAPGSGGIARIGDTLGIVARQGASFELMLEVDDATGTATEVTVEVIRNGEIVRTLHGVTPLREHWLEMFPDDEWAAYYRVIARAARPAYLISNPIFVRRAVPGTSR